MAKDTLCFKITDGLIKAWHEEKVEEPPRSTGYTYLVLNRCTCGECVYKGIDFTAEYDALLKKIQEVPYRIRAAEEDVNMCKLQQEINASMSISLNG